MVLGIQPIMRRSPQSITAVNLTPCKETSPSLVHSTTLNGNHSMSIPFRSNSNGSNLADDEEDDLFGSVAWRKKRAKRVMSKKDGDREEKTAAEEQDGKRWAVMQMLEQRAQEVRDHVNATRKCLANLSQKSVTSKSRGSPSDTESVGTGGGRRRQMLAVPTANGTPRTSQTATSESGAELSCDVIVQEARLLCGSYIYHRLTSKGLMSKRVKVTPYHSTVSEELSLAGQELERLYPRVYTDVSRRISMTMTSAQIVRRALTSVLESMFRSGVTWAKVVSMVAIAAAFAEECVVQGHPNFVEDVVMCVGHFVTLNLTEWLIKQGGWEAFPTARQPVTEKPTDSSPQLCAAALVFVIIGVIVIFVSKLLMDNT